MDKQSITKNNMKTILIAGLGNPGKEYQFTRHNIGFRILDNWLMNLSLQHSNCSCQWENSRKHQAEINQFTLEDKKIILVKPQTFMNKSGESIASLSHYYKIDSENILIIHDDLSFPLGNFKLAIGAGPAGHNGVKSIIEKLGTKNFGRLRVGISAPLGSCPVKHQGGHNFVLGQFTKKEEEIITELLPTTNKILDYYIFNGIQSAMNEFNETNIRNNL